MMELLPLGPEGRELLWNLNQKYLYEMTNFYDDELDEAGILHYGHFEEYFTDPRREALLFRWEGKPAGFALICPYSQLGEPCDYVMAEFTVVPRCRRMHLGTEAARRILEARPGVWEIKYHEKNAAGKALWTGIAAPYRPRSVQYSPEEIVLVFRVGDGGQ